MQAYFECCKGGRSIRQKASAQGGSGGDWSRAAAALCAIAACRRDPRWPGHQYCLLCWETAINRSLFRRTDVLHIQWLISQLEIRHST